MKESVLRLEEKQHHYIGFPTFKVLNVFND